MKSSITGDHRNRMQFLKVFIIFVCLGIILPHFVYADWTVKWDATDREMEITLTDGQDITITKHPTTGGLAVNGKCTDVIASDIEILFISGDNGNNIIDLRGMNEADFSKLITTEKDSYKIMVSARAGNDLVWGSDLGNYIVGGEGHDTLHGGSRPDRLLGDLGTDKLVGDKDDRVISGGFDKDILEIEGKITIGEKLINIYSTELTNKTNLSQSGYLTISDSSGIDTLSFAPFDSSIVLDLDLFNTPQIYTANNDTLSLYGIFEYFIGTDYDDVIYVDPAVDVPRHVDGGGSDGADTLYVDGMGKEVNDDGQTITIQDYQPITYENFEHCVITNTATSVSNEDFGIPNEYRLFQNYPNPFNPLTIILFNIKEKCTVKLNIYNIQGRLVKNLVEGEYFPGSYEIACNGEELPSGIYFYRLQGSKFTDIKKMILLE